MTTPIEPTDPTEPEDLTALAPLIISEWTWPMPTDEGGVHGGIPVRAVEGGLKFVVSPWSIMNPGDHLSVFWGDASAPVWADSIAPGQQNQPVHGVLDPSKILPGIAEPVYYSVKRNGSSVSEESEPKLRLLVKLDRPGGLHDDNSVPGPGLAPGHSRLGFSIPQKIIDEGVDPTDANNGVPIRIEYPGIRKNDRVVLSWGSQRTTVAVTSAQAAQGWLDVLIDKAMIEAAGDGQVSFSYQVIDVVDNYPDPRAQWSRVAYINVDVATLRPDAPLVVNADPDTRVIDLDELGEDDVLVVVNTPAAHFKKGDTVLLTWRGITAQGGEIIVRPLEQKVNLVGLGLNFFIDNAKVKALAQGRATVSYVIKRTGIEDRASRVASASIKGILNDLLPPNVLQAPGGVLNPNEPSATVHIPYYAGRNSSDLVTLIWEAQNGGSLERYEQPLVVGDLDEGEPIVRSVDQVDIRRFDGLRVKVFYRVNDGASKIRLIRTSQIFWMQVGVVMPQFPAPRVSHVTPGTDLLDPDQVPAAGVILTVPYTQTWVGDQVTYIWDGSESAGDISNTITLTAATAGQEIPIPVPKLYVENNRNGVVMVHYTIRRGTELLGVSHTLSLRVGKDLMDLSHPTLRNHGDGSLVNVNPLDIQHETAVIVQYNDMLTTDRISLKWYYPDCTTPYIADKNGLAGKRVEFIISANSGIVPPSVGKTIQVQYIVTRGSQEHTSHFLTLNVASIAPGDLPSPLINGLGNGELLNLNTFLGNAKASLAKWPLSKTGQRVWMTCSSSSALPLPVLSGYAINSTEAANGLVDKAVLRSWLEGLSNNSQVTIGTKVTFNGSADDAQAQAFPTTTYTLVTQALDLPLPVLINATGTGANVTYAPLQGVNGAKVRVSYPDMSTSDSIRLIMVGTSGAGSPTIAPKPGETDKTVEFDIPASAIAANIGNSNQSFTLKYEVTRAGQVSPSGTVTVTVTPLPTSELTKTTIQINQASGTTLDLSAITSGATVRIGSWPFISNGCPVWLEIKGTKMDGTPASLTVWNGWPAHTNPNWISTGQHEQVVGYKPFFESLKDGSPVEMHFKASLTSQGDVNRAICFPVKTYTLVPFTLAPTQMNLNGISIKIPAWPRTGLDSINNTATRVPTGGAPPYSYASSNPAVASVDAQGKVTGNTNGLATIQVTDGIGTSGSYPVAVTNVYRLLAHEAPLTHPKAVEWMHSQPNTAPAGWEAIGDMLRVYGCPLPSVTRIYWVCLPYGPGAALFYHIEKCNLNYTSDYVQIPAWCIQLI